MEKKVMIAALVLAMFVLSTNVKLAESGPEDCIDACYTGCVYNAAKPKAMQRCEAKCRIKCGKGPKAEENQD